MWTSSSRTALVGRARLTLVLSSLAWLVSCGSDSSSQSNDPLRNANVVSCSMPLDHACIEYQRVGSGNTSSFVVLEEARSICAQGWPGGDASPGSFGEGPCPTTDTLARCRIFRSYVELDYYETGFGDTATRDDPLTPLGDLCSRSAGTLEKPPF